MLESERDRNASGGRSEILLQTHTQLRNVCRQLFFDPVRRKKQTKKTRFYK